MERKEPGTVWAASRALINSQTREEHAWRKDESSFSVNHMAADDYPRRRAVAKELSQRCEETWARSWCRSGLQNTRCRDGTTTRRCGPGDYRGRENRCCRRAYDGLSVGIDQIRSELGGDEEVEARSRCILRISTISANGDAPSASDSEAMAKVGKDG